MKIYVVLVDEYISGVNVTHKVSQQGYKTLEEAQSFCRSRFAERLTSCRSGWVYWADATRYEIVEVSI